MSRDVVNATRVKPGTENPNKFDFKVYCGEAITIYDVLYVYASQGAFFAVKKAINTTLAQSTGMLLMAKSNGTSGQYIRATAIGTIKDVDTSSDTVGDVYYLGATAGAVAKTATGFSRRVGTVIKVGTVVNGGRIMFNGFAPAMAGNIIAGTATILNTATTVTITQATLGGAALGGRPVVATFLATDGVKYIVSATWSSNDLVITCSAAVTADRLVSYMISAF